MDCGAGDIPDGTSAPVGGQVTQSCLRGHEVLVAEIEKLARGNTLVEFIAKMNKQLKAYMHSFERADGYKLRRMRLECECSTMAHLGTNDLLT